MKVEKIVANTNIVKKTAEKSKKVFDKLGYEIGASGLPKEAPVEKIYYITSQRDVFERLKEANDAVIDRIKK